MKRDEIIAAQTVLRKQMDALQIELKEADSQWPWTPEKIVHLQSVQDRLHELRIEFNALAARTAPAPSDHLVSVGKASGMVEARVSLAARQIRQTLRDYGHRCAETSLPDLIAADVDAALRKQDEVHAPAPSDGLREALTDDDLMIFIQKRLANELRVAGWHDAAEYLIDDYMGQQIIRAMTDCRNAHAASPAQEGASDGMR